MDCKCETCVRENCQDRTQQDDSRIVTCCSDYLERKMTNADRIRAMSDEELSVFLRGFDKEEIARTTEYALERRKITEWFKQTVEEDA